MSVGGEKVQQREEVPIQQPWSQARHVINSKVRLCQCARPHRPSLPRRGKRRTSPGHVLLQEVPTITRPSLMRGHGGSRLLKRREEPVAVIQMGSFQGKGSRQNTRGVRAVKSNPDESLGDAYMYLPYLRGTYAEDYASGALFSSIQRYKKLPGTKYISLNTLWDLSRTGRWHV